MTGETSHQQCDIASNNLEISLLGSTLLVKNTLTLPLQARGLKNCLHPVLCLKYFHLKSSQKSECAFDSLALPNLFILEKELKTFKIFHCRQDFLPCSLKISPNPCNAQQGWWSYLQELRFESLTCSFQKVLKQFGKTLWNSLASFQWNHLSGPHIRQKIIKKSQPHNVGSYRFGEKEGYPL